MKKYILFWGEFSHDGELFNYTVITGNGPEHAVERFKKLRERRHKLVPDDETVFYVASYHSVVEVKLKKNVTYETEIGPVMIR